MASTRTFQLDELTLRPGTYFNPQTEIMIIVDDTPEVDHEIFASDDLDSSDWVLIAEDVPLDENKRDDLVERFQRAHQDEPDLLSEHEEEQGEDEEEDEEEDEDDEDDELDDVDDLEFDRD
jgi:hypothetical protein